MSRELFRSITISNSYYFGQLQPGVLYPCPVRVRLALRMESVWTPFSQCPFSILRCKCQRGLSKQQFQSLSDWKKCKSICGLACRKKMHIIEERQENENVIHSRALLLAKHCRGRRRRRAAELVVPEAVSPPTANEDDDFKGAFTAIQL